MRLNKTIASRLGISRRAADKLIVGGSVKIGSKKANLTDTITDLSQITVNGDLLPKEKDNILVLLNKPVGYVCSHAGQGNKTIFDLIPASFKHLNPVGRLDKDSSGLLLLTNDGDLHYELTHPSYEKTKIYKVMLDKSLSAIDKNMLDRGVMLDDGVSRLQVSIDQAKVIVKMHEGRNRQIRRTFAELGYKVKSLHRVSFGPYKLGDLNIGDYSIIK
ncbi:MAG: pseudouridine synthase [Candidatus Saccharibacteria bacterium]